jgi:hypothetical protein
MVISAITRVLRQQQKEASSFTAPGANVLAIRHPREGLGEPDFQREKFREDCDQDVYVCPADKILKPNRNIRHNVGSFQIIYHFPAKQCHACP